MKKHYTKKKTQNEISEDTLDIINDYKYTPDQYNDYIFLLLSNYSHFKVKIKEYIIPDKLVEIEELIKSEEEHLGNEKIKSLREKMTKLKDNFNEIIDNSNIIYNFYDKSLINNYLSFEKISFWDFNSKKTYHKICNDIIKIANKDFIKCEKKIFIILDKIKELNNELSQQLNSE